MNPYEIIKRPVVSEKSMHLQNKLAQYTFEVHQDANKQQIKEAVETLFKVTVTGISTMNVRGKSRRVRGREPGLTSAWKKAIVSLADGQKIEGA
ncbi:MAG: 50S ribosomal protein L23 [Planctomycetes bacterium]|jgi:large subunit ribosomal protein L23|nr:50S ribosomal protein L23 [Planctomycetota bacterium]